METAQELSGAELSLEEFAAAARGARPFVLAPRLRDRCEVSAQILARTIAGQRHVYGITTGFGPLANRLVPATQVTELQQNLVHHLATGVGPPLAWDEARAMVLARLMSILQGCSGASIATIEGLLNLLNSGFAPVIPSRGTVGASGDLTLLAHMVLALQGRGDFMDRTGQVLPGNHIMQEINDGPLTLAARDGLALVNGTSAMTGIAALTAVDAERQLRWCLAMTAVLLEVSEGHAEAWDMAFARLRPHPGQIWATQGLNTALEGSDRVVRGFISQRRLTENDLGTEDWPAQDPYTLRCAPQILGAVKDALDWHNGVVMREIHSVTDNPVFPQDAGATDAPALHGGNFMGQHVALASDTLHLSLVTLAGLAERQLARLTDEKLNKGLPPFLQEGAAGLNSGFMGAQVTATALVAEMRSMVIPASCQSLSTNGANQDIVSMGTIAARKCRAQLGQLALVQAILGLALAQAMDLKEETDDGWSGTAIALRQRLRTLSPRLRRDRPLSAEISAVAELIGKTSPPPDA